MRAYCDICQGAGQIRFPVYSRTAFAVADVIEPTQEAYRMFQCPQCSNENMPYERLDIVVTSGMAATQYEDDPKYLGHVKRQMAYKLVDELVKRGRIRIEMGPEDTRQMSRQYKATVGIVAPQTVASFEDRVAEQQFAVAEDVVTATIDEIENWNSHYTGRKGGTVEKSQAVDWMRGALRKVKESYIASRRK